MVSIFRKPRLVFFVMAFLLSILLTAVYHPPGLAEEPQGWYPQNSGTPVHLMAVEAVDCQTAWASGYNGTVLKTTDGGTTWVTQNSGVDSELRSLSVLNADTAWAAGDHLLRTTDGGCTWSKLNLGESFYPYHVCAVNTDVVWVAGNYWVESIGDYQRQVRKTNDGGSSWTTYVLPTEEPILDLCAVDQNNAWVTGTNGLLLKTTDGGSTWNDQDTGISLDLPDMDALDADRAFIVSGNRILRTTDGGNSWSYSNLSAGSLQAVEAVDESTVWAVGLDRLIVKSTDGGYSWTRQEPQDPDPRSYYGVSAADADVAWAVGSDGKILHTVNGGVEPPPVPKIDLLEPSNGYPLSLAEVSGENFGELPSPQSYGTDCYLTLDSYTVPFTNILDWQNHRILFRVPSDFAPGSLEVSVIVNGTTSNKVPFTILEAPAKGWRLQDPGTKMPLFSVSAADAGTAWAVGLGGTIIKTTDGGHTWTPQNSGTTKNLLAVAAASPTVAWAGGEETLLITVDGGESWHTISAEPGYCVYDIAALDQNNCWVVGGGALTASLDKGFVIRTRDGGLNWEVQVVNHHFNMYGIAAVDGTTAWVAGGETMLAGTTRVILRTEDGGAHWTPCGPTDRSWWRIAACDARNAMVWGTSLEGTFPSSIVAECRKTADGGASWITLNPAQTARIYSPLSGAEMFDSQDVWVASSAGWPPYTGIARTVNGGASWSYQLDGYLDYPNVQTMDISAVDRNTAWAVGGYIILHTTDGGYGGPAPAIDSISPTSGEAHELVTIEGRNFGGSQGRSSVAFLDKSASVESWTDTQIVCRAPEGMSNLRVPVTVTTSNGTSNPAYFTYGTALEVLSIEPNQGFQFAFLLNVTVTGTGFQPGATIRLEKGTTVIPAVSVTVTSAERIDCVLGLWGAEPGAYDVVVVNPDGGDARLSGGFTVISACGQGGGAAILLAGVSFGLLSLTGNRLRRRKRLCGKKR